MVRVLLIRWGARNPHPQLFDLKITIHCKNTKTSYDSFNYTKIQAKKFKNKIIIIIYIKNLLPSLYHLTCYNFENSST